MALLFEKKGGDNYKIWAQPILNHISHFVVLIFTA